MTYELHDPQDKPRLPCPINDDPTFKYTSITVAPTDVTKTWRKFGWKPLAELKGDKDENNV
jgi:hypothetical protein